MRNFLKFLIFVVVVSLGLSLLYDYKMKNGSLLAPSASRAPEKYTLPTAPPLDPKSLGALDEFNRERRTLVANIIPSVVSVKTSRKIAARRPSALDEFFFRSPRQFRSPNDEAMVQNSLGSGVIVSNEGHIITNSHVVDQVDDIEVQLSDGRTTKARVVGSDAQVDLAVLKIDEANVKPLKLGDSDLVQAGDMVLAIGNPFGFEETVTEGIISSKGRPNRVDGFGDFLQTDAAINPGNSGGPLINLAGEIIGINTAIISRTGGSQGIGFAIPSNTVRVAMESLLKKGRIIRGYLGIQTLVNPQNPTGANSDGVVVGDVVPGSPAADANLQRGDVIKKFNGRDVKSFPELRSLVAQTELDKKIDLDVVRGGKPLKFSTQLREQPPGYLTSGVQPRNNQQPGQQQPRPQPTLPPVSPTSPDDNEDLSDNPMASLQVSELTPELTRQLDLPNGVRGVVVTNGVEGDLQRGDVIEEIDQQPVTSVAQFNELARAADPNESHVLSICRHRVRSFLVLRNR